MDEGFQAGVSVQRAALLHLSETIPEQEAEIVKLLGDGNSAADAAEREAEDAAQVGTFRWDGVKANLDPEQLSKLQAAPGAFAIMFVLILQDLKDRNKLLDILENQGQQIVTSLARAHVAVSAQQPHPRWWWEILPQVSQQPSTFCVSAAV